MDNAWQRQVAFWRICHKELRNAGVAEEGGEIVGY